MSVSRLIRNIIANDLRPPTESPHVKVACSARTLSHRFAGKRLSLFRPVFHGLLPQFGGYLPIPHPFALDVGAEIVRQESISCFEQRWAIKARFPDLRSPKQRRCNDARAVGAEGGAQVPIAEAFERADERAFLRVPDLRGFVSRRGDDARAAGTECRAPNPTAMTYERQQLLSLPVFPYPYRRGVASRRSDNAGSVRAEYAETLNVVVRAFERAERIAVCRVPDLRRPVTRRGSTGCRRKGRTRTASPHAFPALPWPC